MSEYKSIIETAFLKSWELINQVEDWKVTKPASLLFDCVDKVEWKYATDGSGGSGGSFSAGRRKMFRVTATLKCSVEKVAYILKDINRAPSWNKTLQVTSYYC